MRARAVWAVIAAASLAWTVVAGERKKDATVHDRDLGLSKTSVFATPDPLVPGTTAGAPGENPTEQAYFSGAPPLISHDITDFVPIGLQENACLVCHDLPDAIGEPREQGDPTPIPASHYTDLRRTPDKVGKSVTRARYVCTQCHAQGSDARPLVANTYGQ